MPSEPMPWDRKEYFKVMKEERSGSVGLEDSREVTRCSASVLRKRPVDGNGVTILKGVSLERVLSQSCEAISEDAKVYQLENKSCCSSVCNEESCQRNSQVPGNPNISAKKSCSTYQSDSMRLFHLESASELEKGALNGDIDKSLADGTQHSSNQCHSCKPIRWTRSGSLSSHESCLSHSMSSKSMSVDFVNSKVEVHRHIINPCQSASGDTVSCLTPTTPSEETSPWKRPRLKWGEGLAKFEKKSLIPDDRPNKSETISGASAQLSDCASPATPSSAACSSFPGSDDKPFTKASAVSNANDSSPALISENLKPLEIIPFSVEKVDLSTVIDAVPSLIEMINFEEKCSENFGSASTLVMQKLLLLKSELLKAVDMTESEVDLLENELKSLNNEHEHSGSRCLESDSPAVELIKESDQVPQSVSEVSHRPAMLLHEVTDMFVNGHSEVLKADVDSAGRVTSKLVEHPSTEPGPVSGMINDGECVSKFDTGRSSQEVQKSSKITAHAGTSDSELHISVDENAVDSSWASNQEYTNKASEDLNIVYPVPKTLEESRCDVRSQDMCLRELFLRKKKALLFKELVVALKWRAIHSIWKNDLQLFSVRNHFSKAQKKLEICSQTTLNNRPSVRSKSLNMKKSSLNLSKLLSSSHLTPCESFLKMPALILDDNEKKTSIFLSSNGLVEDPYGAEKERSIINAWSSEERELFWDKIEFHGKDFRKIACILDHKSIADCVQFYYKNHKSQSFRKAKKHKDRGKIVKPLGNSTYLVTPAKKWDRVVDTASLDILGAASELVARNCHRKENKKRNSWGLLLHSVGRTRLTRKDALFSQRPNEFRAAEHENRTPDNEVLPGVCGSVSSEPLSSCITSSVNQGEVHHNGTHKTFSILRKPTSIPEDILVDDEETCSDESSCELNAGCWTDTEKSVFVRAVQSYGKDFCMVSRCIPTKSKDQCKSFYSKAYKCLGLDIIHPDNDNDQQSVVNDSNGDRSGPVLAPMQEAVPDVGDSKVSQRIHADVSLSVPGTSNRDSLSPYADMTSHACHDKSKDIEGNLEKPCADLKVEVQIMDKSISDPLVACVGSKLTMSNDKDKQVFQRTFSESTNKPVSISHSLSSSVPIFGSLAQLGEERGLMESPLLRYHVGENVMSIEYVQNKVPCLIDDRGKEKVPCQRSADFQPLVGITAGVPRQMYESKGKVKSVTSQNRLAFRTSCGVLNPSQQHIAGLPTPEISFARNSFEETGRYFQGSNYAVNHVMQPSYVQSNHSYVSQTFEKVENNKSAWNLNFEDSTISRGSHSDSESGLPSYASIPRTGYVQKCQSLNSNPNVGDLFYFRPSSHCSRNQKINSVGSEKQGKQTNIKLFGKVLIPSTVPVTPSLDETKLTQFPQMKGPRVDMNPPNHHSIFLDSENLHMRSFWDGRLMQTVPLLTGCPVPLSYGMSSSSVLGPQPLQMTAIPNTSAAKTVGSIFDSSLGSSVKNPHISHATQNL